MVKCKDRALRTSSKRLSHEGSERRRKRSTRRPQTRGNTRTSVVTAQAPRTGDRLEETRSGLLYIEKDILQKWHTYFPDLLKSYGFKSYGANQSRIFIRAGNADNANLSENDSNEKKGSKLAAIYKNSSAVRERRVYGDSEQIKRYLRHCAAKLAERYQISGEIQCYYNYSDNIVYIATNMESEEKALKEIDQSKVWDHERHQAYIQSRTLRASLQSEPYRKGLSKRKTASIERKMKHSISCPDAMKNARFRVVESRNAEIPGLHAERKILYALRRIKGENYFLNPLCLGGIRRPCFVCAALCFESVDQVRPGPVWISLAASTPRNIEEAARIIKAIIAPRYLTYVSRKDDGVTIDNDTESCEDVEDDQAGVYS